MLPPLPKQRRQHEAEFGLLFRRWIEKHPRPSGSYELKDAHGEDRLPFARLKAEQVAYANKINHGGALIRVLGINGEPDYVWLYRAPAYVVIRYPRCFTIIDVGDYVWERDNTKHRSLSVDRAKVVAIEVVDL